MLEGATGVLELLAQPLVIIWLNRDKALPPPIDLGAEGCSYSVQHKQNFHPGKCLSLKPFPQASAQSSYTNLISPGNQHHFSPLFQQLCWSLQKRIVGLARTLSRQKQCCQDERPQR